ncbi:ATP-binding cassette domain-containing protein [Kineococcus glutinatus]
MRRGAAPAATGAPLVAAHGITKSYGAGDLFCDLSLQIHPGERWAFTGPSGAGKTTLGNALLRLTPVDAGTVVHAAATRGGRVQKLYQDPGLSFPRRVPLEVTVRAAMRRHGVPGARLAALLEQVGIAPEMLRRRPDQVSGGELQRIAIVRAMLPRPVLLFADEATSRLDVATQQVTTDVLVREVDEAGCALLLVTHDDDLAAAVADRRLELPARGRAAAPA